MNNKNGLLVLISGLFLAGVSESEAQLVVGGDLLDNCGQIESLVGSGNFAEARDTARSCLDGIEQQLVGALGQFFLPEVGDWTRTSFDESQVMGITNISATYEKGDIDVDVSLMGQAGGGGGPLGAAGLGNLFGGIAQNALLQSGQQVTVAGLPSSIQDDGTLTVPLEDGSMLMFESRDLRDADTALAGMGDLVNDFPVAEINAALQ